MNITTHIENRIISVKNFITPEWCEEIIKSSEETGFDVAKLTTTHGQIEDLGIRDNRRLFFKDQSLANDLFVKLKTALISPFGGKEAVALNEMFRVYRYENGQKFDWHQDGFYESPENFRSRFTFMIYLNDGFSGGGTTFADWNQKPEFEDFTILPETGKALLFFHPIPHRGDPVHSGRKYVLRTDIMYTK